MLSGNVWKEESVQSPSNQPLSLQELLSGATKTLDNAQGHVDAAALLLQHQDYPLAFGLAHLACEETTKSLFLLLLTLQIARGDSIDWKKVEKRLCNHWVKIIGSLLLDLLHAWTPYGDDKIFSDPWKAAELLNVLKNQSLYVSLIEDRWSGDTFLKPSERVDPYVAQATVGRARIHLQHAQSVCEEWSKRTGMTEEDLRTVSALPELQAMFQMLEQEMGMFDLPREKQQQKLSGIIAAFNLPGKKSQDWAELEECSQNNDQAT